MTRESIKVRKQRKFENYIFVPVNALNIFFNDSFFILMTDKRKNVVRR